jgi:hypothetical protein
MKGTRPGLARWCARRARYSSTPAVVATRLMTSGRFTPCQTARLYSGMSSPRMLWAAEARNGPTVSPGSTPTSRHMNTSSALGNSIHRGGSCGARGRSVAGGPKNTWRMKRSEYATLNAPAMVARSGRPTWVMLSPLTKVVSAKNISLDRKPLSSGTPAIDAAATMASVAVMGMALYRPDSRLRSRVPVSWSTTPAAMKSEALKVAWLIMWKMAATSASVLFSPSSSVISPRWLMVE